METMIWMIHYTPAPLGSFYSPGSGDGAVALGWALNIFRHGNILQILWLLFISVSAFMFPFALASSRTEPFNLDNHPKLLLVIFIILYIVSLAPLWGPLVDRWDRRRRERRRQEWRERHGRR